MKLFRTAFWKAAALGLAAFGLAGAAQARSDVYWSVGVNAAPGVVIGASNAPMYYAPRPIYVAPAPVYYAPAPVYYAPSTYYYGPSYRVRAGKHRHHRHHRHHRPVTYVHGYAY
jgi:hypothetical protein